MAQLANALQQQAQAMQAQNQAGGEASAHLLNQLLALNQTLTAMGPMHSGLVQRLPTYSGSTNDNALNAWLDQVETLFQAMNCNDVQRLALARTSLTGVASQFITQLIQAATPENPVTWDQAKQALLRRFVPTNQAFALRKRLASLKYKEGQDIQTFLFEFQKLLSALEQSRVGEREGTPGETDKMHFLLEALPPKLQTAMLLRQPETLQGLTTNVVAYCQARIPLQTNAPQPMEVDALKDVNSEEESSEGEDESLENALNAVFRRWKRKNKIPNVKKEKQKASIHVNAPGKTYNNNDKQFKRRPNNHNNASSSTFKSKATCHRCGIPGHYASECYANPDKVRAYQKQTKRLHSDGKRQLHHVDEVQRQASNENDSCSEGSEQ